MPWSCTFSGVSSILWWPMISTALAMMLSHLWQRLPRSAISDCRKFLHLRDA
ncbi:hypothetical protein OS242_10520 [Tumebacillus sp. DT12]|uniref:Uncharacterized protein n=1 Tax=Tumebacillus lacus TaxID=2995335 RepID=A0ABT3X453_9BACL|nr:hypothetical protein [Tumebacillus lacus]MCX7570396.1 hypothetical protein [Tumebacillus lacus]